MAHQARPGHGRQSPDHGSRQDEPAEQRAPTREHLRARFSGYAFLRRDDAEVREPALLAGHSAGGQFAHRFAMDPTSGMAAVNRKAMPVMAHSASPTAPHTAASFRESVIEMRSL